MLRAITGRDERTQTVMATAADTDMATAADTDRAPLSEQVHDLLWQHERTRNRCRADYRRYISERCSGSGYDLAAELPALREEIRHNRRPGR